MKNLIGAIVSGVMGFFSGVILLTMFLMILDSMFNITKDKNAENSVIVILIILVILALAWFFSSYLLTYQNDSISKTFARGFLLWATEWLLMVFVTLLTVSVTSFASNKENTLSSAITFMAGGTTILISVGFCFLMSFGCMIGYAISILFPREMQPSSNEQNFETPL
jgi:chromate transport protein ChrA